MKLWLHALEECPLHPWCLLGSGTCCHLAGSICDPASSVLSYPYLAGQVLPVTITKSYSQMYSQMTVLQWQSTQVNKKQNINWNIKCNSAICYLRIYEFCVNAAFCWFVLVTGQYWIHEYSQHLSDMTQSSRAAHADRKATYDTWMCNCMVGL